MKVTLILLSVMIIISLAHAQTYVSGVYETSETWTSDNSPYIVIDNVTFVANTLLTIQSGVIVKFNIGKELNIQGGYNFLADELNPIVFTSSRDDEYGGDSNGDGNATIPEPGNWRGLIINTSTPELKYLLIRYAGWMGRGGSGSNYEDYVGAITLQNCSPVIHNCTFDH